MKFNCLIIKWRYSFLCFNHVWNMNRQYVSILTLEKQSVSIFYEFIKLLQRKERMKSKGRMDYGIRSLKDQRLYQNSVVLVHCINVKAPQRGKWFNLAFESVWSSLILAISARLLASSAIRLTSLWLEVLLSPNNFLSVDCSWRPCNVRFSAAHAASRASLPKSFQLVNAVWFFFFFLLKKKLHNSQLICIC